MPSLTPIHRSEEATSAAARDGIINGMLALIPSTGAVYAAMKKSPKFVKSTNWQSRTALAIMPPFFMYALTSEKKLNNVMREMADEADHAKKINEWAEENKHELKSSVKLSSLSSSSSSSGISDSQLHALYRKSVEDSGVRIIPGDSLGLHHKAANFFQSYPFTILSCLGGKTLSIICNHFKEEYLACIYNYFVALYIELKLISSFFLTNKQINKQPTVPAVGYIFMGRNDQKHLQLQSKLMHTRVFGQFTIIGMLLTIMGFKTYMDSMGKFITQREADIRVAEMTRMREDLMKRIAFDKEMKAKRDAMLRKS